jgi:hypothetical protein
MWAIWGVGDKTQVGRLVSPPVRLGRFTFPTRHSAFHADSGGRTECRLLHIEPKAARPRRRAASILQRSGFAASETLSVYASELASPTISSGVSSAALPGANRISRAARIIVRERMSSGPRRERASQSAEVRALSCAIPSHLPDAGLAARPQHLIARRDHVIGRDDHPSPQPRSPLPQTSTSLPHSLGPAPPANGTLTAPTLIQGD